MKFFYNSCFYLILLIFSSALAFSQGGENVRVNKGGLKEKVISERVGNLYPLSKLNSRKSEDAKFFDDFESYDDFSLEFGDWVLVDVDDTTTYTFAISFPNEGKRMAYIIMNPLEVNPPVPSWDAPSGNKFATCIAAQSDVGGSNDDWMISPEITLGENDVLSFFARSQSEWSGLEKFQVYISETASTDLDSFVDITGAEAGYIEPPLEPWTKYQFELDKYANKKIRFAIRCISFNATFFMVDDVQVAPMPTVPSCQLNENFWHADTLRSGSKKETGLRFSISNYEGGLLQVTEVTDLVGTDFSTTLKASDVNVPRNGSYEFGFSYNPTGEGQDSVAFIIKTNANGGQSDTIILKGYGYYLDENTVEIGTEKNISVLSPIANYYQYSISQTIYTKEELQVGANSILDRIQLKYRGADPSYNNIKIYLTQLNKNEFFSKAEWDDVTEEDLYFDNMVYLGKGQNWITFNLRKPFTYDPTKDLIVTVKEDSDYYVIFREKSNAFFVSNSLTSNGVDYKNMSMGVYTDKIPAFDIYNLPKAHNLWKTRPNIRFFFNKEEGPKLVVAPTDLLFDYQPTGSETKLKVDLYNSGTEQLVLTDIEIPAGLPVSFDQTSMVIEAGERKTLAATFLPATADIFEGEINFVSNSIEDVTVDFCGKAYKKGYLYEGFEDCDVFSFPPEGWSIKGNTNNWMLGTLSSNAYERAQFAFADPGDDYLITPELFVRKGDKISFCAKSHLGFTVNAFFAYWSKDKVEWHSLPSIVLPSLSKKKYACYEFDLPEAAEGKTYIAFKKGGDLGDLYLDLIRGPQIFLSGSDLKINDIKGSNLPVQNENNDYVVTIKNTGESPVSTYSVQLLDQDNNVLATTEGDYLESLESKDVTVTWIPDNSDITEVRAKIVCTDDENSENDFSEPIDIFLQKAYSKVNSICDVQKLGLDPIDPSTEISFSQTIILKEEIADGGYITGIALKNNYKNDFYEKRIYIYLSETEKEDLTDGFIPVEGLEKVYDKRISLPRGTNHIYIPFNKPYLYKGKNLVLTFYRSESEDVLFQDSKFFGEYDEKKTNRSRYFAGRKKGFNLDELPEGYTRDFIPYTRIVFDTENCGAINGKVNEASRGVSAINNVHLAINEFGFETYTNDKGEFNFPYIPAGNHKLNADAILIEDEEVDIDIKARETLDVNIGITLRPVASFSTVLIPSFNNAKFVEGAEVTLTNGELKFTGTSDADGNVLIENILCNYTYDLLVSKEGFDNHTAEVEFLEENIDLGKITLNETAYPAILPLGEIENDIVKLNWFKPGSLTDFEFRHDDGVNRHHIGYIGQQNSLVGAVYKNIAYIKSIKWFLEKGGIEHETCQIYILGIDENGIPDRENLIYKSDVLTNIDEEWNTHVLPNPIYVPRGFYVALNTGILPMNLAGDDGVEDPYVVKPKTMFSTPDWKDPATNWTELGIPGHFPYNLMVRAEGFNIKDLNEIISEKDRVYTRAKIGYTIKRGIKGTESDFESWKTITPSMITDTIAEDSEWASLPQGLYVYGVVTHYDNGVKSIPVYSNVMEKDMYTSFNINVKLDSDQDTPEGTIVTLKHDDGNVNHVYSASITNTDGSLTISNIYKGLYSLRVEKGNFTLYTEEDLDMSINGKTIEVTLEEVINKPFAIEAKSLKDYQAKMNWHDIDVPINEFFEDKTAFSSDFGNWISLDKDGGSIYKLTVCSFPGETQPHGFFVFAPNETEPSIFLTTPEFAPYGSSAQYAVSFSGPQKANDDWLISPKFVAGTGTVFSFFAKSADIQYGRDRFRVLVSEDGSTETADFKVISEGDYQTVGKYYEKQEFDLSKYAGKEVRVAIQCVSKQALAFCVDNVYIGLKKDYEGDGRKVMGYNIYFEDMNTPIAKNVDKHEYILKNLEHDKEYQVGVSKVFSSKESEIEKGSFVYKVTENVEPIIKSSPKLSAEITKEYKYELQVVDYNNDDLNYTLTEAPEWLELVQENEKHFIVGTPSELGDYEVKWEVTDGKKVAKQSYTLKVTKLGLNEGDAASIKLYPNPVQDFLYIDNALGKRVEILSLEGVSLLSFDIDEISFKRKIDLESGTYIIKVIGDKLLINQKLVIQ
ncbi:MAG: choice-of-anchor J domain-containing protein [Hyphomicrobiales bacterium]